MLRQTLLAGILSLAIVGMTGTADGQQKKYDTTSQGSADTAKQQRSTGTADKSYPQAPARPEKAYDPYDQQQKNQDSRKKYQ